MARFAIVIDNTVNNIIIADNLETAKTVTAKGEIVELKENDFVDIGFGYDNEKGFISNRPEIVTLTPEETRTKFGIKADNE